MIEQELRDEFEKWKAQNISETQSILIHDLCSRALEHGYSLAQETIKSKDAEIENLIKEAKKELSEKDKTIAHLSSECTRLFDPTRKFWNDEKDKAIAEARFFISSMLFWLEIPIERRNEIKAWLESNK